VEITATSVGDQSSLPSAALSLIYLFIEAFIEACLNKLAAMDELNISHAAY